MSQDSLIDSSSMVAIRIEYPHVISSILEAIQVRNQDSDSLDEVTFPTLDAVCLMDAIPRRVTEAVKYELIRVGEVIIRSDKDKGCCPFLAFKNGL
jgi:hypothetical protein